jgi:7-cyano-7-deazaguanine synthase
MIDLRTVVLHSGGLDSSTLLAMTPDAIALTVHYGQRHAREIRSAKIVADHFRVEHVVVDLQEFGKAIAGSALTDSAVDVPEGHYTDESMAVTVVPFRNGVLLSVAAAVAEAKKARAVAYAAHAGDHAIYPDCRPEFADAMDAAINVGTTGRVHVVRPLIGWTKQDIAVAAIELGVPVERTWSCYRGGDVHCGRCATCFERREAFFLAGIDDPTTYADKTPIADLIAAFGASG